MALGWVGLDIIMLIRGNKFQLFLGRSPRWVLNGIGGNCVLKMFVFVLFFVFFLFFFVVVVVVVSPC